MRFWYLLISIILSILFLYSPFGHCQKKPIRLEEMVVTATRTEKRIEHAPGSVCVITKDRIDLKGPDTFDQVLNDIPGVFVRRGKGLMDTLSFITLRGIPRQNRTLILMDGIVLNSPYTGVIKFGGFSPGDLERVEVVKGPFSSLYGGYAMGGVVNFITKIPQKRELKLKLGYGSGLDRGEAMDDLKSLYLSYGDRPLEGLGIFLSYGRHDTNGYPSDLNVQKYKPPVGGYTITKDRYGKTAYLIGNRGDNTWWDDCFHLKTRYEFNKDTNLTLSFIRNRYEYGYEDPKTYLLDALGNPLWSYTKVKEKTFLHGDGGVSRNIYSIRFETAFNRLKSKLNLSFLDTDDNWYITPGSGATKEGCAVSPKKCGYISSTPSEAYMVDVQFDLPLFKRHLFTFGTSFRYGHSETQEHYLGNWKDEDSKAILKYESKGKERTYALFIQDEIHVLKNLTAYLGLREDWWKSYDGYADDVGKAGYPKIYPSKSKSSFSPKLAIVWTPVDRTTLKGSIGKAFRSPTIYELYRTWTSSYGSTYAGNPDLDPETVISWDMGIEQRLWKGAKTSITYFENHMEDLIYRKSTKPKFYEYVNVGEAESRGVEFELEQKIENWLRLFGNFTYTDSEIKENKANPKAEGCRLTYLPLWRYNIGAEFKRWGLSGSIIGRYVDKWFSKDDNSDKEENVYGSYDSHFLLDARICYQIKKNTKLSLSLNNIFDEDYFQYYRAPGRSWFLGLSIVY
ncbi:MAG TPA: TonB-dependent receptor [Desulfobacteraceae bacterium]|nr:TonB-dependent receptor [Desulfobacteraceae bacterium]